MISGINHKEIDKDIKIIQDKLDKSGGFIMVGVTIPQESLEDNTSGLSLTVSTHKISKMKILMSLLDALGITQKDLAIAFLAKEEGTMTKEILEQKGPLK